MTNQLRTYINFFDYVYVVVHHKHTKEVQILLDKFKLNSVGLIEVSDSLEFSKIKEAKVLDSKGRFNRILHSLKKDELKNICETLKTKPNTLHKDSLVNSLIGKVSLEEIESLFKKSLVDNHYKVCPLCKSNLVRKHRGHTECFSCGKLS